MSHATPTLHTNSLGLHVPHHLHSCTNPPATTHPTTTPHIGFSIHGMHSTHFTPQLAEDFMDVYKGIYPSYSQMIEHLAEAPLLALMITGEIEIY